MQKLSTYKYFTTTTDYFLKMSWDKSVKFKKKEGLWTWMVDRGVSYLFRKDKNIICYKRIGYKLNVIRQSACLVFNPIILYEGTEFKLFNLVVCDRSCLGFNWWVSSATDFQ